MPIKDLKTLDEYSSIVTGNTRISFRLVELRGDRYFQILKQIRKDKWPEGMWHSFKSSPLLNSDQFKLLVQLLEFRSKEIMEMLNEDRKSN